MLNRRALFGAHRCKTSSPAFPVGYMGKKWGQSRLFGGKWGQSKLQGQHKKAWAGGERRNGATTLSPLSGQNLTLTPLFFTFLEK